MSVIDDIDDHGFVLATHLLVELCREIEKVGGRKPTLDDLCELLTWGLRGCSADILEDVNTCNVVRIRAEVKKRGKITLKAGDLVAIPSKKGGYFWVVYITKNTFGFCFGIFRGRHPLREPEQDWQPDVFPYPLYSGEELVASRKWLIIGNYPRFLSFFPHDPPLYHYKKDWTDDKRIGPFGAAESPSGKLRKISKEEAEAVGLLTDEYIHGMSEEEFEDFLERRFGDDGGKRRKKSVLRP